jgi:hypothetical protein
MLPLPDPEPPPSVAPPDIEGDPICDAWGAFAKVQPPQVMIRTTGTTRAGRNVAAIASVPAATTTAAAATARGV